MKKIKSSMAAKIIAFMLFVALALAVTGCTIGCIAFANWGGYSEPYETVRQNALEELAWNKLYECYDMYINGMELDDIDKNTNFRFSIYDTDGKKLFSNKENNEDVLCRVVVDMKPTHHVIYSEATAGEQDIKRTISLHYSGEMLEFETDAEYKEWLEKSSVRVTGYVLKNLKENDAFNKRSVLVGELYHWQYTMLYGAISAFVLMLVLLVFLISAAGHRKDTDEIVLSFVDKVPLDIFLCFATALIFLPFVIASELGLQFNTLGIVVAALVVVCSVASTLLTLLSLAVRIKSRTLWKNCLVLRFCNWCLGCVKAVFRFFVEMLRGMTLDKRWALIIAVVLIAEIFLMLLSGMDGAMVFFLWFLNLAVCSLLVLWCVNAFGKLRRGAKELAQGSLSCNIDTRYMRGELKEHADDLMNIREGMNRAVAERMKSERFQSELITNVSHDIKTPLTSIVNYVDLLEKEELDNQKAKEYVDVLSRQSAKLKKLIGDLIEASKASTGVLTVNAERCDLSVLLEQCAGEYKERLENAGLRLMLSKPDEEMPVMADGRHMWRIMDNLMNNVIKYAQPGTRVYLSLGRDKEKAVIVLRNISRDELNLSGEELMERFVRGDSSRSGEGSGLGLAIARSLCQLQGGDMSLSVDGDLFKVTLKFDTI